MDYRREETKRGRRSGVGGRREWRLVREGLASLGREPLA
jgi:hypothetical protein